MPQFSGCARARIFHTKYVNVQTFISIYVDIIFMLQSTKYNINSQMMSIEIMLSCDSMRGDARQPTQIVHSVSDSDILMRIVSQTQTQTLISHFGDFLQNKLRRKHCVSD